MRGVVGVMSEIMIDQIGEEAIAVNIEIDQGSKQEERPNKTTHVGCHKS